MKKTAYIPILTALAGFVAGFGIAAKSGSERVPLPRDSVPSQVCEAPASSPSSAESPVPGAEAPAAPAAAPAAAPSAPPVMKVHKVRYDGEDDIAVTLGVRPDMNVVRHYVSVEPMNEGVPSFRFTGGENQCVLHIAGDFAFGTNVTLRLKAGLPPANANSGAKGLEEDYVYEFTRNDLAPRLSLVDSGRYLPPGGVRALNLKSVNVTNVALTVREVPTANIVPFLALEESAYEEIRTAWWSDSESVARDLAAEPDDARKFVLPTLLNKRIITPLELGTGKGIFYVAVTGGDDVDRRVVCISDIGLSVREAQGKLLVWATSLTTGEMLRGVEVEAYSTANIPVARGVTDESGLAMLERTAKGEPFAVVASIKGEDGKRSDATFIALRASMQVDEMNAAMEGDAVDFLEKGKAEAFVWTERGIYRHGEKIFLHAILRDEAGRAPAPFPLIARLRKPSGKIYATANLMPNETGAVTCEDFVVGEDEPSGQWLIEIATPGEKGETLGERKIEVEEFAPPTIRVKVEAAATREATNFAFTVKAEQLYGGPARALKCEGAVTFEDVPFAPAGWDGWNFGNERLGLKPCFRRVGKGRLDDNGENLFPAPLWESAGLPVAAVKATAQGTAFEDGGREATARASAVLHVYPYYIGTTLKHSIAKPDEGMPQIEVACVVPDGDRAAAPKSLLAKIERIDTVYSYRKSAQGWASWSAEKVSTPIAENLKIDVWPEEASAALALPVYDSGDYFLTIVDPESNVTYGKAFYLGGGGDEAIRATLGDPAAVSITPDKAFYRVGEVPRLLVKAPFAGNALLTVLHKGIVYAEAFALTNATSEITLPPVERGMAPSVDVTISVVHGAEAAERRLAARSHGECVLSVRPAEREIPVEVKAAVDFNADSGASVAVDISAPGADYALVTLVDEGINILTGEKRVDPVGYFARKRIALHPLYDLYHRLLPVVGEDELRRSGVKTGGGFGAELLSRISPQPSRRFKPLAMWKAPVALKDGRAEVLFELPEFAGEVRISAIAYSAGATGAATEFRKVAPKVILQADAPRFVAPGDTFEVTMSLANRSGAAADIDYTLAATGPVALQNVDSTAHIAKDGSKLLVFSATAGETGEAEIVYTASGCGERHEKRIFLPVRPGAPWREEAGVDTLKPGETKAYKPNARESFKVFDSPAAQLSAAYDWLADYPHGCLEQTCSRVFPLLASGEDGHATFIDAGVRRVASMMRENDFVMWPDCNYAPWDKEVSLWAAHFLVAARAVSAEAAEVRDRVIKYLGKWAMSTNTQVSAYACHTLALAGRPEKDRMLKLYDEREKLSGLDRARLARAFIAISDRQRAVTLLEKAAAPGSLKEAAFSLLALLDLDPADERIAPLALYLNAKRDYSTFAWGTTEDNAHALLALGEYLRRLSPAGAQKGAAAAAKVAKSKDAAGNTLFANNGASEAFVAWRRLVMPDVKSITNEQSVITLSRRFLTAEGAPLELAGVRRGDLVNVVVTLGTTEERDFADLVIEDLFPAAFEPVYGTSSSAALPSWLMRTDVRDDRFLAYSKRFHLKVGEEVEFTYQVRAVTAGAFLLPGTSVEAMYFPLVRARLAPERLVCIDED